MNAPRSSPNATQGIIRRAAALVRQRLGKVAWCRWIKGSHVWMGLGGIVLVAVLRWFAGVQSVAVTAGMAGGLLALWLLVGWLWSLSKRPSDLGALSILDEKGGWKETFSSALAFEKKVLLEEGERLHVRRAQVAAESAVEEIDSTLPIPSLAAVWILPVLMLGFAVSPLLVRQGEAGDQELTDAMREAAAEEAAHLADAADSIDDISKLDDDEKDEMDRLKEAVDGVAEELADAQGMSARDVLEALEERARAAERLAEKLGAADNAWASEEMLREMGQHVDTADLATSIRDKNAQASAEESESLAQMLDREELTRDIIQRVTEALDRRPMQKATEEDTAKPVGEHVGNASRKMGEDQPKPAARDFGRLADHFRRVQQREKAQAELKKLAAKLRESGSKVSGAKMEPMKQLADAQQGASPPAQMQPLGAPQENAPGSPQAGQTGAPMQVQGAQPLRAPGLQNPQGPGQQQLGQQGAAAAPVPGAPQPGGKNGDQQGLAAGQPGGDKDGQKGKQAMLSAPIPGMNPGQGPSGASLGGQAPNSSSMSSNGGLEAGNATAELGNDPSQAIKAGDQSTVTAQINEDGESTLRAVEGQARAEQAQVARREAAVNFIQIEEDALDEKALPMSRRGHVLKYFTELRDRFEPQEGQNSSVNP